MARRSKHRRKRKDNRHYGQRYSFTAINKAMGNPRRGKRGKRRGRRNPGGLERTLRDGTSLSLHRDGDQGVLYIHHAHGGMDDFKSSWATALRKFKAFKSGRTYSRSSNKDAWAQLAMDNPRHRRGRGRKTRRNCGMMVEDPRWAVTRIMRKGSRHNPAQFPMPFSSALNPGRRGRKGHKSRRNPAQFPMPFASALNPGRRTRRNHPISRKQARSMGKVLRQHGYKRCKIR